jgi:hypothetical protein
VEVRIICLGLFGKLSSLTLLISVDTVLLVMFLSAFRSKEGSCI